MPETAPNAAPPSAPAEPAVAPAGPSSTPAAAPAPAASPTPATPAEPVSAAPPAEPPKVAPAEPPKAPEPLFKLPDDLKVDAAAVSKFETVLKAKTIDGRLQLTPQDVVDMFAEQARDAHTLWQTQITTQDAAWKAESAQRFSKEQLALSETGVAFLRSFDPDFVELTKGIANHPTFVNAMRVIGERLSEDSLEIEGARPTPARRSAADVLYGKRN
jgi:hypothetical protein